MGKEQARPTDTDPFEQDLNALDAEDRLTARERATLDALLHDSGRNELVPLVGVLGERLLTEQELEKLEEALLDVLTASLDEDGEPTPRGAEADALIGRLQPYGEHWHRSEDA